jgi:tetraacyldisaccharide 4'-kinase
MTLEGDTAVRLNDATQGLPLSSLTERTILAAAGIGHPARFFAMLSKAGLRFETLPLTDHFDFVSNPFTTTSAEMILITEKDAVKCRQNKLLANDPRLWVVPVDARIEPALAQHIVEKLRGYPTA